MVLGAKPFFLHPVNDNLCLLARKRRGCQVQMNLAGKLYIKAKYNF